jgi:hypothetical protein
MAKRMYGVVSCPGVVAIDSESGSSRDCGSCDLLLPSMVSGRSSAMVETGRSWCALWTPTPFNDATVGAACCKCSWLSAGVRWCEGGVA